MSTSALSASIATGTISPNEEGINLEVQSERAPMSEPKYSSPDGEMANDKGSTAKNVALLLAVTGLAISTIVLAVTRDGSSSSSSSSIGYIPAKSSKAVYTIFKQVENKCFYMKPRGEDWQNYECFHKKGPQAGANVTEGFQGLFKIDVAPNTNEYWQSSMCPVNVHWHLGTEHYSIGEYDENGDGPHGTAEAPKDAEAPKERRLAEGARGGFRCHHYDEKDPKFTKEYDWKHCKGMEVGETYEVHWPHSAAGACGTVDQYQTPFYDGVFCNLPEATAKNLSHADIAGAVGVQAQIYTIVNDETYYYPDMMRGWIKQGEYGEDIAYYTGSTTGTSRNNDICSAYSPITWQVDRKCHLISASSFDKLCFDMKNQRDDMSEDLHAHGSRVLVAKELTANNMQRRHLHEHEHEHDHDGHDHVHLEWF